ncbi:nucleotidyltransferase domain-containing protein [Roseateles paludis]|uniref:Nucleotidyltransferase family protein n=1 Tax=Roseateles paludis TaxID=3145238 RepID=A0ABV0G1V4_9BURK
MADLLTPFWARPEQRPDWQDRAWEAAMGQARRGRLTARLALKLSEMPGGLDAVPSPQRDFLQGALRVVHRHRQDVLFELDQVRRSMKGVPGPIVLLKGAAYLAAELPAARGRVFSDIDLMVAEGSLEQAESALLGGGWISQERDAYNQRYYRQWMHEIPPLEHVQRGTVLDLHHTISPPTSRFKVDGRSLLARARPLGDSGFHVLAPEDMVLHSAVHLYQEGEFDHGMRDLLDLHELLLDFGRDPSFWPTLVARAEELSLGEPLSVLLTQRQQLLGIVPPADLTEPLKAFQPHWPRRQVMQSLLALALRPQHPDCDTLLSRCARRALYLRSHLIRMPLHLLVPHLVRKAWMARMSAAPAPDEGAA